MKKNEWSETPTEGGYSFFEGFVHFRKAIDIHPCVAIYLVEEGAFSYSLGGGVSDIVNAGELVFCPPEVAFRKEVVKTVSFHLATLRFPTLPDLPCEKLSFAECPRIYDTLSRLKGLEAVSDPNAEGYRLHLVRDLWYSVLSLCAPAFLPEKPTATDPFFREMAEYIKGDLSVGLSQLASVFSVSRVTVNKCFKRSVGCTAGQYVTAERVSSACRLLEESDLPLGQIAESCGFSNEYYFSSVFSRSMGVAPGEYRRRARRK